MSENLQMGIIVKVFAITVSKVGLHHNKTACRLQHPTYFGQCTGNSLTCQVLQEIAGEHSTKVSRWEYAKVIAASNMSLDIQIRELNKSREDIERVLFGSTYMVDE